MAAVGEGVSPDVTEYGGHKDRYRTPNGEARLLSVAERAALVRRAGLGDRRAYGTPLTDEEIAIANGASDAV